MLLPISTLYFRHIYLANAGIPLFSQSVFYQIVLLIPIILIEAYAHKKLLQMNVSRAIWVALSTNFVSTLVGGLLILLFIAPLISTLLFGNPVPVQPGNFPFLPLEIMVTLIPMFWFSVVLESWVGCWSLKQMDRKAVKRSFLIANGFTYAMLEILAITQLIRGYMQGRG